MYSLEYSLEPPLVPKRRRIGVTCRMNASGKELLPLDEDEVGDAAKNLIEKWEVGSIAVCYLHAYRNPAHERRTAEIIKKNGQTLRCQFPAISFVNTGNTREPVRQ